MAAVTSVGYSVADARLCLLLLLVVPENPISKPCVKPLNRYEDNVVSGWCTSASVSFIIFTGVVTDVGNGFAVLRSKSGVCCCGTLN